jgi:hypothetical protein
MNSMTDMTLHVRGGLSPSGAPDRNTKIHRNIPCTTGLLPDWLYSASGERRSFRDPRPMTYLHGQSVNHRLTRCSCNKAQVTR